MRVAIYARYSSDQQSKESTAMQIAECRKRLSQLGIENYELDTFADEAISGTRSDRPEYQRLLTMVKDDPHDIVIAFKQSRLGRDSIECEKAIRLIEARGVRLLTCDGYDTHGQSKRNRKLMRQFRGIIDEAYIDDLREFTVAGLESQFRKGYWCGGRVYGYDLQPVLSQTRKDPYGRPEQEGTLLEINPEQAAVVKEMFRRFADGESPGAIAADFNRRGIPSPGAAWKNTKVRRIKGWSRSGVFGMLPNELYNGTYRWKKTRREWVEVEQDGRVKKSRLAFRRASGEWVGEPKNAAHLQLVPDDVWKRAQARLNANKGKPVDQRLRSGGRAKFLLSGVLRCPKCGSNYVIDSKTHYRCQGNVDGRRCDNGLRFRRTDVEDTIVDFFENVFLAPEAVALATKLIHAEVAKRLNDRSATASRRPAELEEIEARIERLRNRQRTGDPDLTRDELQAAIERAEAKRNELVSALPSVRAPAKVLAAIPAAAKAYQRQFRTALAGADARHVAKARAALRQLCGGFMHVDRPTGAERPVVRFTGTRLPLLAAAGGGVGTVGAPDRS